MNISFDKKKLIQTLFGLAIIILVANIIVDKVYTTNEHIKSNEIKGNIINVKFLNTLRGFGLKNEWIKKYKARGKKAAEYSYDVKVPKDLPITVILHDIFDNFDSTKVKLKPYEKEIGGETILTIYSDKKLKLSAKFNYDDSIERNAGSVGLVIKDFYQLNKSEQQQLLKLPNIFAVVITPSKASANFVTQILSDKKEYAVLLNDDISDLDFKLETDLSDYRLRLVLSSIVKTYSRAIFFMISSESDLYNSPIYKKIAKAFKIRGIKLITENSLESLNPIEGKQTVVTFDSTVKQLKEGEMKIISLTFQQYLNLQPEITRLRKIGYKFINPSLVIYPPKK